MRLEKNRIRFNEIVFYILLIIIILIILKNFYKKTNNLERNKNEYSKIDNIKENSLKENSTKKSNIKEDNIIEESIKENIKIDNSIIPEITKKEEIITNYKGYDVIAKLEIPKINLKTYILNNFSENALNISVTKFWGPEPNEIGNLCIAGHNFNKKNMFHNLKKLKIGDIFFISDNCIGKLEYEIYDIYNVFPEDISCLSQKTNGKRIVTLITCTSDSKKRIIVKACEINKNPKGN